MSIKMTLSANSGISLEMGGLKIWVDALHSEKIETFSAVSPKLIRTMEKCEAFQSPDIILATHCHPDHYSGEFVARAKERYPHSVVITPGREIKDQIKIRGEHQKVNVKGAEITFFMLPHEYVPYKMVPHYGIIITKELESVLFTGDCKIAAPELAEHLGEKRLTAAQFDFPWLTSKFGREYLKERINADHIIFTHLPFEEDDGFGYRRAAEKALTKFDHPDVWLLKDPLQEAVF